MNPDLIRKAWDAAEAGQMYAVVSQSGKMYVVPPWESGMTEAPLYLFLSTEACHAWKDGLDMTLEPFTIGSITLNVLMTVLPKINEECKRVFGVPVKVELCGIDDRAWPVEVDVLWSEHRVLH